MPSAGPSAGGDAGEAEPCACVHECYDSELDGSCDGLGWSDDEELAAALGGQYALRRARQRDGSAAQAVVPPAGPPGVLGGCDADGG